MLDQPQRTTGTHEDSELGGLVILLGKEFVFLSEQIARLGGITPSQWAALHHVGAAGPGGCAPSELAVALGTSRANATKLLAQLVRARLASEYPSPVDGRGKRIWLSSRGRSILAQLDAEKRRRAAEILAGLTEAELDPFLALSQRLLAGLRHTRARI